MHVVVPEFGQAAKRRMKTVGEHFVPRVGLGPAVLPDAFTTHDQPGSVAPVFTVNVRAGRDGRDRIGHD